MVLDSDTFCFGENHERNIIQDKPEGGAAALNSHMPTEKTEVSTSEKDELRQRFFSMMFNEPGSQPASSQPISTKAVVTADMC